MISLRSNELVVFTIYIYAMASIYCYYCYYTYRFDLYCTIIILVLLVLRVMYIHFVNKASIIVRNVSYFFLQRKNRKDLEKIG